MKKEQKKKIVGYIALTTVLVILPLLLLSGINTIYTNITLLITGKMQYDYNILEINAESCLEESVYKIKKNRAFTGTFTITRTDWNCTSEISDKPDNFGVKIIQITAVDQNENHVKMTKELNTNTDPFEISNI
ncbi:MAG TPA: hypothetical protein VJY47_03050 [Candidatus Dojkabacteria bacterium]|nr:hypothetical protein [Candidatus Dojkabacteria bacterium]